MNQPVASRTALYDWHVSHGGRMVEFAGYEMPIHYETGILREHLHTRSAVGLFDVSHMGVAHLRATDGRYNTVAELFERLVPADAVNLKPGQQRYTQLLNAEGGIRDDLMFWRPRSSDNALGIVVNAARKAENLAYIARSVAPTVFMEEEPGCALVALQGPGAEATLASICPDAKSLSFMQVMEAEFDGVGIHISRSGYTGEDGFEIGIAADHAVKLWTYLVEKNDVRPIGLGARDSLRLEAGMCLYGADLDETTSPVEANLSWSLQKRRREAGGFPGAERIKRELRDGPERLRVGLRPAGAVPLRAGVVLYANEAAHEQVGMITSGGFGPSIKSPVSMGYVRREFARAGTSLSAEIRGRRVPVDVHEMPFVPHSFKR